MLRKTYPTFGSMPFSAERRLIYVDDKEKTSPSVPLPDDVVAEIKKAGTDESLRVSIQEFLRGETADAPARVNRDMQLRIYQIDSVDKAKAKELASSIPTDRSGLVRFLLVHEIISAEEYESAIQEAVAAKNRASTESAASAESAPRAPAFNPDNYAQKDAKYYDDLVRWKRDEEQKVDQRIQEQWSNMDAGEGLSDLQLRLAELAEKMEVLEKERKSAQQQRLLNRPSQQRGYTSNVRQSMAEGYQEASANLRMVGAELGPIYKEYNALNVILQKNTGEKFASWRLDLSEKGKEELKKVAEQSGQSGAKIHEFFEYAKKQPGRFAHNKDYFNDYDFASRIRARDERDTDLGRQWDREVAEERAKQEEAKRGLAEWHTNPDEYNRKAQRKSADRRTESMMGWNSGEMQRLRNAPTNSEASFNAHLTNARKDGYEVTHSSKGSADIDKTQYAEVSEDEQSDSAEQGTGSSSRRRDPLGKGGYMEHRGAFGYGGDAHHREQVKSNNRINSWNIAENMEKVQAAIDRYKAANHPRAEELERRLARISKQEEFRPGTANTGLKQLMEELRMVESGENSARSLEQLRKDVTGGQEFVSVSAGDDRLERLPLERKEIHSYIFPIERGTGGVNPYLQIPIVVPAALSPDGIGHRVRYQPNDPNAFSLDNDINVLRTAGIWIERQTSTDGKTTGVHFHFTREGTFEIAGKPIEAYPEARREELRMQRRVERDFDSRALAYHTWNNIPAGINNIKVTLPDKRVLDIAVPRDVGVVDDKDGIVSLYREKGSSSVTLYFFEPGDYVITGMDAANHRNIGRKTLRVEARASQLMQTASDTPQQKNASPESEAIPTPQPSLIRTPPESGALSSPSVPEQLTNEWWPELKTFEEYQKAYQAFEGNSLSLYAFIDYAEKMPLVSPSNAEIAQSVETMKINLASIEANYDLLEIQDPRTIEKARNAIRSMIFPYQMLCGKYSHGLEESDHFDKNLAQSIVRLQFLTRLLDKISQVQKSAEQRLANLKTHVEKAAGDGYTADIKTGDGTDVITLFKERKEVVEIRMQPYNFERINGAYVGLAIVDLTTLDRNQSFPVQVKEVIRLATKAPAETPRDSETKSTPDLSRQEYWKELNTDTEYFSLSESLKSLSLEEFIERMKAIPDMTEQETKNLLKHKGIDSSHAQKLNIALSDVKHVLSKIDYSNKVSLQKTYDDLVSISNRFNDQIALPLLDMQIAAKRSYLSDLTPYAIRRKAMNVLCFKILQRVEKLAKEQGETGSQQQESERKQKEAAERKAKEEADQKTKEAADKLAAEEAAKQKAAEDALKFKAKGEEHKESQPKKGYFAALKTLAEKAAGDGYNAVINVNGFADVITLSKGGKEVVEIWKTSDKESVVSAYVNGSDKVDLKTLDQNQSLENQIKKALELASKEQAETPQRLAALKTVVEKAAGDGYTAEIKVSSTSDVITLSKGGKEVVEIWKSSDEMKINNVYIGNDSVDIETLDKNKPLPDQIKEVMKLAAKEQAETPQRLAALKTVVEKAAGDGYTAEIKVSSTSDVITLSKGGKEVVEIWKSSDEMKINNVYIGNDSVDIETLDKNKPLPDQIKEVMKLAAKTQEEAR